MKKLCNIKSMFNYSKKQTINIVCKNIEYFILYFNVYLIRN